MLVDEKIISPTNAPLQSSLGGTTDNPLIFKDRRTSYPEGCWRIAHSLGRCNSESGNLQ